MPPRKRAAEAPIVIDDSIATTSEENIWKRHAAQNPFVGPDKLDQQTLTTAVAVMSRKRKELEKATADLAALQEKVKAERKRLHSVKTEISRGLSEPKGAYEIYTEYFEALNKLKKEFKSMRIRRRVTQLVDEKLDIARSERLDERGGYGWDSDDSDDYGLFGRGFRGGWDYDSDDEEVEMDEEDADDVVEKVMQSLKAPTPVTAKPAGGNIPGARTVVQIGDDSSDDDTAGKNELIPMDDGEQSVYLPLLIKFVEKADLIAKSKETDCIPLALSHLHLSLMAYQVILAQCKRQFSLHETIKAKYEAAFAYCLVRYRTFQLPAELEKDFASPNLPWVVAPTVAFWTQALTRNGFPHLVSLVAVQWDTLSFNGARSAHLIEHPLAMRARIQLLTEHNRLTDAMKLSAEHVRSTHPDNGQKYIDHAWILLKLQKPDQAIATLASSADVITKFPSELEAMSKYCMSDLNDPVRAFQIMSALVEKSGERNTYSYYGAPTLMQTQSVYISKLFQDIVIPCAPYASEENVASASADVVPSLLVLCAKKIAGGIRLDQLGKLSCNPLSYISHLPTDLLGVVLLPLAIRFCQNTPQPMLLAKISDDLAAQNLLEPAFDLLMKAMLNCQSYDSYSSKVRGSGMVVGLLKRGYALRRLEQVVKFLASLPYFQDYSGAEVQQFEREVPEVKTKLQELLCSYGQLRALSEPLSSIVPGLPVEVMTKMWPSLKDHTQQAAVLGELRKRKRTDIVEPLIEIFAEKDRGSPDAIVQALVGCSWEDYTKSLIAEGKHTSAYKIACARFKARPSRNSLLRMDAVVAVTPDPEVKKLWSSHRAGAIAGVNLSESSLSAKDLVDRILMVLSEGQEAALEKVIHRIDAIVVRSLINHLENNPSDLALVKRHPSLTPLLLKGLTIGPSASRYDYMHSHQTDDLELIKRLFPDRVLDLIKGYMDVQFANYNYARSGHIVAFASRCLVVFKDTPFFAGIQRLWSDRKNLRPGLKLWAQISSEIYTPPRSALPAKARPSVGPEMVTNGTMPLTAQRAPIQGLPVPPGAAVRSPVGPPTVSVSTPPQPGAHLKTTAAIVAQQRAQAMQVAQSYQATVAGAPKPKVVPTLSSQKQGPTGASSQTSSVAPPSVPVPTTTTASSQPSTST